MSFTANAVVLTSGVFTAGLSASPTVKEGASWASKPIFSWRRTVRPVRARVAEAARRIEAPATGAKIRIEDAQGKVVVFEALQIDEN
jgi:hypothetical protein